MSNTIDKMVLDLGKSSNSALSHRQYSTYYHASKIIELMDRKRKMINLKIAVEDAISKLNKTDRRIMTLVFFDGAKSEMIAKLLGISLRTYFRKKVNALVKFADLLQEMGYDSDFFQNEYSSEKWFMAVYDECVSKGCDSESPIDKYLIKRVFNEMSKTGLAFNTYRI
jgi:hypothetical protein